MKDQTKTKQALIQELSSLKHRIQELERAESERKQVEEALQEREEKYRTILQSIEDGYFEQDLAGNFIFLNNSMSRIYGYPKEELMGMNYKQHTDPENGKKCFHAYVNIYKTGQPGKVVDFEIIRKDGTKRNIESSMSLIKDSSGNPIAYRGIVRDITERKETEGALRESEKKYRNILESIQEGYFELDLAGNYTFVNEANCRFLGYTKEELVGMNYRQHTDEESAKKLYQPYRELYRTGKPIETLEVESFRKDGIKVIYETSVSLIRDSEGNPIGFRGISRDITERKRAEDALRESEKRYHELSIVDDLTQLYNSRHFYFQLKSELDRSNRYEQPLTLLLLDLDNFKAFNDAYGHVEGHQVLWRLGQVVKRCLRETDFAFRYGGEEFTILLPMTTSADGAVTAERIRIEFKQETFSPAPGQDVHVTVSIGLA